jgi:periplasmic protein CpxP/Spy
METVKFLKWIVGILLIVNFLTIFFAWFSSFPPHDRGSAAKFLSKELDFSPEQEEKYAQLRDIHQIETRKCNERSMELKKKLYHLLALNAQSSEVGVIMDSIGFYSKKTEMVRFEHFQDVRKICSESQKARFDQIIGEVIKMMSPPPPKRK